MRKQSISLILILSLIISFFSTSNINVMAAGSISLSGTTFQPLEYVTVTVSNISSTDKPWVGLIPANVNEDYDSHDVLYAWVSDLSNNQWTFQLPIQEAQWKVGVFLEENNDQMLAMSSVITAKNHTINISTNKANFEPDEAITVTVSEAPVEGQHAWVGLIPANVNEDYDSYDIKYSWVSDLSNLQWTLNAPTQEGSYKFGVFLDNSDDFMVGMSQPFTVGRSQISMNLSTSTCQPGDEVTLSFDRYPIESSGWLGLVPADTNEDYDSYDVLYVWLSDTPNGQWTFNMPWTEGSYKVGMFIDNQADLLMGMSGTITSKYHTINVSMDKTGYVAGESITATINELPVRSGAWLGLIPADINVSHDSHDIKYIWANDLTGFSWTFDAPDVTGSYKIGVFLDNDNDQVIGMGPSFVLGQIGTPTTPTTVPTPSDPSDVIFSNQNISGVGSGPSNPTTFTLNTPHTISNIQNYHYYNGGVKPGTISLQSLDGNVYGPWQSTGSTGQGSVANAYWDVYPTITIPAGTYTILDSNNPTWSNNSGSNYSGMTIVKGYSDPNTMITPPDSSASTTTTPDNTSAGDLPDLTFTDFEPGHWAYPYVQHMVSLGIITGYPDNTFKPKGTFSRAAFAKLLSLSFEMPDYMGNDALYSDLPSNHWAYNFVMSTNLYLTAYQKADGSKVFLPNDNAVREDVAVAMVKAMGLEPDDADMSYLNAYNDADDVSENLRAYIALAIEYGVMKGSNSMFNPQKPLTRAEASTLFSRYLTNIKGTYEEDDGLIKVTN